MRAGSPRIHPPFAAVVAHLACRTLPHSATWTAARSPKGWLTVRGGARLGLGLGLGLGQGFGEGEGSPRDLFSRAGPTSSRRSPWLGVGLGLGLG